MARANYASSRSNLPAPVAALACLDDVWKEFEASQNIR